MPLPSLCSVLNAIRNRKSLRKPNRERTESISSETLLVPNKKCSFEETPSSFECPIQWKVGQKWHRRTLLLRQATHDASFWFTIFQEDVKCAVHHSMDLMHIAFEPLKPIGHFVFSTGILSMRFLTRCTLVAFQNWSRTRLELRGVRFPAQLVYGEEGAPKRRLVNLIVKCTTVAVVDGKRKRPMFFAGIEHLKEIVVGTRRVSLYSGVSRTELHFECTRTQKIAEWARIATILTNRRHILTYIPVAKLTPCPHITEEKKKLSAVQHEEDHTYEEIPFFQSR